jgi:hypothetical protein
MSAIRSSSRSVENSFRGLLFRCPAGADARLLAAASGGQLGAAGSRFEIEPLFAVSGRPGRSVGVAGSDARAWLVARPVDDVAGAHPWEAVYESIAQVTGLLGIVPEFVEPDLAQPWLDPPAGDADALGFRGARPLRGAFEDQVEDLPHRDGEFAWHLADEFSQLRTARAQAATGGVPHIIRIAHLDTGYDQNHGTFPEARIEAAMQRNFADGAEKLLDARDPNERGTLKFPGHGTGTLSILAGARHQWQRGGYDFDDVLGGAPHARIVPIRVGDSVVQLTTSAVARAIRYVVDLCKVPATRVDVISMSMGGVASAAWADVVNEVYDAGVVFVAAAGNNISAGPFGIPTRHIVYPARFRRVLAACGVMANGKPYYGLSRGTMQGNWGPDSKMSTALAAYTPNMPWAEIGAADIVDMDGAGTSSATPQVAAAAALYLQHHAEALFDAARYPSAWMRVEAVRHALLAHAKPVASSLDRKKLGRGLLRAADALDAAPIAAGRLAHTSRDRASFAFLRVLTGFGVSSSPIDRLLELEATQLAQRPTAWNRPSPFEIEGFDPDAVGEPPSPTHIRQYLEAIIDHPEASPQLRQRADQARSELSGKARRRPRAPGRGEQPAWEDAADRPAALSTRYAPPLPAFRELRVFATDPSLARSLDTVSISEVILRVPWETLKPGPCGEYLEVIDAEPGGDIAYAPVDLDDPRLLAQDGLPPSEGTPQFHQQMVYAVCSATIRHFERALGRKALWRPLPPDDAPPSDDPQDAAASTTESEPKGRGKKQTKSSHRSKVEAAKSTDSKRTAKKSRKQDPASGSASPLDDEEEARYVPRLRVYPHAFRGANAYYSPQQVSLRFGYFDAAPGDSDGHLPGGCVFTCLSQDIIAHETSHALLDGMHRRFLLPTNPDVRAFHEAFADIVALFQHFTHQELLAHQLAAARGDLRGQHNFLAELAAQFGYSTGRRGALRSAIGSVDPQTGDWMPYVPRPDDYQKATEAHLRGAVLVAAIFDAFLSIYERRVADLKRLATGGSGVLRPGAIHPDLVSRMAEEAAKAAQHVLRMCIRALDYCPPVDITFGEYLRAVVTADYDLVPHDPLNYRLAFVEAFRARGIYPARVPNLSVESLRWLGPQDEEEPLSSQLEERLRELRDYVGDHLFATTREEVFMLEREMRRELHRQLSSYFKRSKVAKRDAEILGVDWRLPFEVHSARVANRSRPDGGVSAELIVSILQRAEIPLDPDIPEGHTMPFEGGSTIVADLKRLEVRYCIRKRLTSERRRNLQRSRFEMDAGMLRATHLGGNLLDDGGKEPFASWHRG